METAIAKAFLTAAGMPDDKFEELDKLTADKLPEFKADDYLVPITEATQTKFLNDPKWFEAHITEDKLPAEFKKKIESGQYGRFTNELKDVATKVLGLKEGEDFTAEDVPKLKIFAEKIAKSYLGKNAPKGDLKELQDKLVDAIKLNEGKDTEWTEKLNSAVNTEKQALTGKLEKYAAIQQVAGVKDLIVKPHLVAETLHNTLKSKYAVVLDPETMDFQLRQKDHPELKVLNGSKEVTYTEALSTLATELGLIKAAEGGAGGSGAGAGAGGTVEVKIDGDVAIPDYIKAKMDKEEPKK